MTMTEWSSIWTRIGNKRQESSFADSDSIWIPVEKDIHTMKKALWSPVSIHKVKDVCWKMTTFIVKELEKLVWKQ